MIKQKNIIDPVLISSDFTLMKLIYLTVILDKTEEYF